MLVGVSGWVFGFWLGLRGFSWSLPSTSLVGCVLGFFFPLFGGIVLFCPIHQFFLVFLGPWVASAALWGLRSSEPRGWLFVCLDILDLLSYTMMVNMICTWLGVGAT